MNFQYYETLMDKSDKIMEYYAENIRPVFTKGELPLITGDLLETKVVKNQYEESKSIKGYYEIGEDYDAIASLSNLKADQYKILFQAFISRELCTRKAIKWRFYQYMKFMRGFVIESLLTNISSKSHDAVDFVIEIEGGDIIFVLCTELLEIDNYMELINKFINFSKETKIVPKKVIIAANKSYRNIPIQETFLIEESEIVPELWVEWVDLEKVFSGDDLLTIVLNDNEQIELAGYNFSSTESLLDYIYEYTEGGQISLYKQVGYFSELSEETHRVDLIWKGIMIKT